MQLHRHICPRQVLGIRMSLLAQELLGLPLPQAQADKRVLTIVETDGCFSDGVAVAANCWVGRRTLRVEDYGKVAATYIDTHTEQAWRIVPRTEARSEAADFAPEAEGNWEAMLYGYRRMPTDRLLVAQRVALATPSRELVSLPGLRATCDRCGEEIMNAREVVQDDRTLCRACVGPAYYRTLRDEE